LQDQINAEKILLEEKLRKGEISQIEWRKKVEELDREYETKLNELRKMYRRVDILIKREKK